MKRVLLLAGIVWLAASVGGCVPACPTDSLRELMQQNPKPTTALAALATEAKVAAAKQGNTKNAVSCYRVASVAAWQSEDDNLVLPITTAGGNACNALPQQDADAPTDCTLIRLAEPMAVQDAVQRNLATYQARKDASPTRTLPAADFAPLQQAFDDLETQFAKVTSIGQSAAGLAVPAEVHQRIDAYRLLILCNAIKAWSLSGACDDAPTEAFTDTGQRNQAMVTAIGLSNAEVVTQCRRPPVAAPLD